MSESESELFHKFYTSSEGQKRPRRRQENPGQTLKNPISKHTEARLARRLQPATPAGHRNY